MQNSPFFCINLGRLEMLLIFDTEELVEAEGLENSITGIIYLVAQLVESGLLLFQFSTLNFLVVGAFRLLISSRLA